MGCISQLQISLLELLLYELVWVRRAFNIGKGVAQSQPSRTLIFYQEQNGLICHHSLVLDLPIPGLTCLLFLETGTCQMRAHTPFSLRCSADVAGPASGLRTSSHHLNLETRPRAKSRSPWGVGWFWQGVGGLGRAFYPPTHLWGSLSLLLRL